MRNADASGGIEHLRLRDRILDRATIFAVGLVLAATVGSLVGVLTAASVPSAVGYALIVFGAVWLLSAGLSGGGYAIGGVGKGVSRYTYLMGDGNEALLDELREGYNRLDKDPIAFWQAIGGILYIAIGFIVIVTTS